MEYKDEYATFTFGYLIDNVYDWGSFCADIGLNPYLINEGLADRNDVHSVKIKHLKRHGILK